MIQFKCLEKSMIESKFRHEFPANVKSTQYEDQAFSKGNPNFICV